MATIISELGAICMRLPGYSVQVQASEMLITVALTGGRRQTVKVWTCRIPGVTAPIVRLQSRAAVVNSYTVVRDALRRNARMTRAAFAMDTSVTPPVLDIVSGMVINPQQIAVNDFLDALHEVASLADQVEAKLSSGADRF